MIPIYFDKTETDFTTNGIGRLTDCISCKVTEERNGIYELELEYPITGQWYDEMMANGGIIGVIHDDNHDIQPFDIYMSTAPIDGIVTFYAHHISYRLNNIILQPFTATTAAGAVAGLSTNSVNTNPFSFSTDKVVTADFAVTHPTSVRSVLFGQEGSLLDVYGTAEFKFDKWDVEMLLHRGSDTGVTVRYGKNMTDVEWSIDNSGTYNAIAPYWTDGTIFVYPNGIIVQPTTPISPVKPVAMDFSDKFEQQPTKQQLTRAATDYLDSYTPWAKDNNIRVNFLALWQSPEYENVAAIQRVGLCDTVSVYYTDMGLIEEKKQVVRVVFDVLAERFEEMELGDLSNSYVAIDNGTGTGVTSETINRIGSAFASCLSGKKVSIIGDSISTFDLPGYKTEGYAMYYPNANIPDLKSVDQTWWKRVIDASGCVLEANAAYSGSCASNVRSPRPDLYQRCSTTILGNPDTIIVELGTNDSIESAPIGDFDFETAYANLPESTFATAYIKGIKALQDLYPNAQIICVALYMGTAYASAVARIATHLGCKFIVCSDYEKGYSVHPNAHGMRQIASAFLAMQKYDSNYSYVINPSAWLEDGDVNLVDDDIQYGVPPSSNVSGSAVMFKDMNANNLAVLRYYARTSGETRLAMAVYGDDDNNTQVSNYFQLQMKAHGIPGVTFSHPDAWLEALGLGTSGVLPVTLAQGGTGATDQATALSNLAATGNLYTSISSAQTATITASGASAYEIHTYSTQGTNYMYVGYVYARGTGYTPEVKQILAASGVTVAAAAGGKVTINTSGGTKLYICIQSINQEAFGRLTVTTA